MSHKEHAGTITEKIIKVCSFKNLRKFQNYYYEVDLCEPRRVF